MPGVSPAIRAAILESRPSTRDAILRWRRGAEYRAAMAAFADCPPDDPGPATAQAERLLADDAWLGALLGPMLDALAADPFFEPPFKPSRDALRTGAILFDCPAASISASVTSAAAMAAMAPPTSLIVSGRVQVMRTLGAGGARLRRWRAEPLTPGFSAASARRCEALGPRLLADGETHRCDGRVEAQLLEGAARDVVSVVATIRAGAAPLMREYAIADRRLLRVVSADDRASRTEMLLAFLRLSGRADAACQFEAVTRDPAFHLRWAAMREWLALDARAALPRLGEMAVEDPNAEVRAAAGLTLAAARRRVEEARCRG